MRCGVPVPSIISSLPFAACVFEVPRLNYAGLHNVVAQLLLPGVPVFIACESVDVNATVAALKATVAEDMYQCDVAIYNLSTKTPLYTSTFHLVPVCAATAFDNNMPHYVAFTEEPMSSVMPVEIFSFLLSLVPVPKRAGNWFLLGTLSVYFASMMSTRFSKDCNVVCALLGEETVVSDEFVQSIKAAITNADACPPKSPVYCRETGVLRSFVIVVHCLWLVSYLNIALGVKRCRPETTNIPVIGPPSLQTSPLLPVGRCPSPCRSPSISRITFWQGYRSR